MKNKIFTKILVFTLLLALTGCGKKNEETTSETPEAATSITLEGEVPPEELLDAFLAGEIPAFYDDGKWIIQFEPFVGESYEGIHFETKYNDEESVILLGQQPDDEMDYFSYSVGERIDLDNDGEKEQIVNGPYGGIYFDARDGKVYVLAEGGGTADILSYTYYDNATWIVYSDTTHGGRQIYELTKFDGKGNVVDEFILAAAYWDSPTGWYDESSTFSYRDEEISMEDYERLTKEIFEMENYTESGSYVTVMWETSEEADGTNIRE